MKKYKLISIISLLLISCYSFNQIEDNINTPNIASSYTPSSTLISTKPPIAKLFTPTPTSTNISIPTVTPTPTNVIIAASPDEVTEYGDNIDFEQLKQIYQRLDISFDLFQQSRHEPFSIQTISLDNLNDKYTMVIVSNNDVSLWQYLVFRFATQKETWHFLGHVDVFYVRAHVEPHQAYQIITADEANNWLVVQNFSSGSGFSSTTETWYKLDGQELTTSLSYLLSGLRATTWPVPVVDVRGHWVRQGIVDGVYTLEFDYRVKYDTSSHDSLFTEEGKVYYVWNEELNKFRFDTVASELDVCALDNPLLNSLQERVTCHYDSMMLLAKTGNITQTKWLSEYLSIEVDYPEKDYLIDVINRR